MKGIQSVSLKDRFNDEIFISLDRFCELKGVSRTTLWRKRAKKDFNLKIVKVEGQGKKLFVVIKKESIIFINKENSIIL